MSRDGEWKDGGEARVVEWRNAGDGRMHRRKAGHRWCEQFSRGEENLKSATMRGGIVARREQSFSRPRKVGGRGKISGSAFRIAA